MAKQLLTIMYRYVNAQENSDKFYEMKQLDTEKFRARWGRWGSDGLDKEYPMTEWERVKNDKITKGYKEIDRSTVAMPSAEFETEEYDLDETAEKLKSNGPATFCGVILKGV
jgi:predicted DNA-binding WGR domain protein